MNDETEECLDEEWIREFECIDNEYNVFYKEDVLFVKVNCVFINRANEIECVKSENVLFATPNTLPYSTLLEMIDAHKLQKYEMTTMLKYNFSIDPAEIKSFLKHRNTDRYLTELTKVDTIVFEKTIGMFQDLNEVNIFFREKKARHTRTSKVSNGRLMTALKKHRGTRKRLDIN